MTTPAIASAVLPQDQLYPYDVGDAPDAPGDLVAGGDPSSIAEVAADLRARFYAGEWPAGSRLPTREVIAADHGVTAESAGVALRMLRSEGLVRLDQGRGTFARPLHDYDVRIGITRLPPVGRDEEFGALQGRLASRAAAEPAVTGAIATEGVGAMQVIMEVRAPGPAQACVTATSVLAVAAGPGWDHAGAFVSAEPAR